MMRQLISPHLQCEQQALYFDVNLFSAIVCLTLWCQSTKGQHMQSQSWFYYALRLY